MSESSSRWDDGATGMGTPTAAAPFHMVLTPLQLQQARRLFEARADCFSPTAAATAAAASPSSRPSLLAAGDVDISGTSSGAVTSAALRRGSSKKPVVGGVPSSSAKEKGDAAKATPPRPSHPLQTNTAVAPVTAPFDCMSVSAVVQFLADIGVRRTENDAKGIMIALLQQHTQDEQEALSHREQQEEEGEGCGDEDGTAAGGGAAGGAADEDQGGTSLRSAGGGSSSRPSSGKGPRSSSPQQQRRASSGGGSRTATGRQATSGHRRSIAAQQQQRRQEAAIAKLHNQASSAIHAGEGLRIPFELFLELALMTFPAADGGAEEEGEVGQRRNMEDDISAPVSARSGAGGASASGGGLFGGTNTTMQSMATARSKAGGGVEGAATARTARTAARDAAAAGRDGDCVKRDELRAAFAMIDHDGDGVISTGDLKAFIAAHFVDPYRPSSSTQPAAVAPHTGPGTATGVGGRTRRSVASITAAAAAAMGSSVGGGVNGSSLAALAASSSPGKDSGSLVSAVQTPHVHSAFSHLSSAQLNAMLREIDVGDDGTVTFDDFCAAIETA